MEINDSFRVSRSIDETWNTLLDIERIAPALPGAELQEVDGDEYKGVVKVKVGPITAQYKGTATLAEVDEANRSLKIDASGRDSRGQGNARAAIAVAMHEEGDGTVVEIATDLHLTGKVAQFARGGMLQEVSEKLLGQFAQNLERDILGAAPGAQTGPAGSAGGAGSESERPEPASGPRRIESVAAEPVDLLDVAGAPLARRLVPLGIAALVLFVLWRLTRRRRRG